MPKLPSSPFQTYQHRQYIHSALRNANKPCEQDGFRLLGARKQALGLICESLRVLGTSAIQGQLAQGRVELTQYQLPEARGAGQDDREASHVR